MPCSHGTGRVAVTDKGEAQAAGRRAAPYLRAMTPLRLALPLLAALAVGACRTVPAAGTVAVVPPASPTAMYTPVVRAGGLLFLAGRVASDSIGKGIRAETREILAGIARDLQAAGSGMDRVARCMVLLVDIAEWGAMNEAYAPFFPGVKPARTAVQIVATPRAGARVEIECIAAAR